MEATKIRLEPYAIYHIDLLYHAALESREELFPFMPWCHENYQFEDARKFVLMQLDQFASGASFEFAIMSEENLFLGGCGLNQLDRVNRRANLGYWIRTSSADRGIATAAVKLLETWAWEKTDLVRLEIVISTENHRSSRVAAKAGAVFEGLARSRLLLHGRYHDARIYALIRPDTESAVSG